MKSKSVRPRSREVPANPFDLRAVATFGQDTRSVDDFSYVRATFDEADQYLSAYPDSTRRFGGAIGLVGGHGSGKTHLLNRLSAHAKRLESIAPTVLYSRSESSSLFDLLRSFLTGLSREGLQELIGLAHLAVAVSYVRRARVSETLVLRLDSASALTKLYAEHNLEEETVRSLFMERLYERLGLPVTRLGEPESPKSGQAERVPRVIPDTMLRVDDPVAGDAAFAWLTGSLGGDLAAHGFDVPLQQCGAPAEGVAADDAAVIATLKVLGAIHEIAGVPLILLVDELEALVRTEDQARRKSVATALKELFEQMQAHNVLLFLAGTDNAWELRRDVFPRLRLRQPILVGSLTPEETRVLLNAFTAKRPGFQSHLVERLRDLTGGNIREMIRMGYHAYEATGGNLSAATESTLLDAARAAGTIQDRITLALEIATHVLESFGSVQPDIRPRPDLHLDLLVMKNDSPVLALLVIAPPDQVSEVDSARQIATAADFLNSTLARTPLLVVSVGYSSDEIRKLLAQSATIIQFDEAQFASKLRAEAIAARTERHGERNASEGELRQLLVSISKRLDGIEKNRQRSVEERNERIAEGARTLSEADAAARSASTRWQFLEVVDHLQNAARFEDLVRERELLRSMLIGNEANLKLESVDALGRSYLEVIEFQLDGHADPERMDKIGSLKERIRHELRQALLRRRGMLDEILEKRWQTAVGVGVAVTIGYVAFIVSMSGHPVIAVLEEQLAAAILAGLGGAAYAFFALAFLRDSRHRRIQDRVQTVLRL